MQIYDQQFQKIPNTNFNQINYNNIFRSLYRSVIVNLKISNISIYNLLLQKSLHIKFEFKNRKRII